MKSFIVVFCISASSLLGQFSHENIFIGKTGAELLTLVQQNFRPAFTLDYTIARDTLFRNIDAVDHQLECIYTGMKLPLTDGVDPTEEVYLNGIANGINTEHAYPQSYGLDIGIQRSDMHNLFPCRIATNSDRGNLPFGESPDNITEKWYYLTQELTSKPTQNIDFYSELGRNNVFEPREAKKGNIARAIFYIFTMYREEVSAVDTTFFLNQKNTLCSWHYGDPVDEVEWNRTHKISIYQDGKRNPFVLDCSLASRLYCDQISEACELLTSTDIPNEKVNNFTLLIIPNPISNSQGLLKIKSPITTPAKVKIYNILGGLVQSFEVTLQGGENPNFIPFEMDDAKGMYFIHVDMSRLGRSEVVRLIVE